MIRRPPRSTHCISSAASDVYKRQNAKGLHWSINKNTGQETRTKTKLPQGNKWGRTKAFSTWIHSNDKSKKKKTNEEVTPLKSFKSWLGDH